MLLVCFSIILLSFSILQASEPSRNVAAKVSLTSKDETPDVVSIVKGVFNQIFRKKSKTHPNSTPPIVGIYFDKSEISRAEANVNVFVDARDNDNDTLLYKYTVSAGKIVGEGSNVVWDLSGVEKGIYALTIEVDDGCGCVKPVTKQIKVVDCLGCDIYAEFCPKGVTITPSAESIREGEMIVFTANAEVLNSIPLYNWTISSGEIIGGQNTSSLIVKATPDMVGKIITASVSFNESCKNVDSAIVEVIKF